MYTAKTIETNSPRIVPIAEIPEVINGMAGVVIIAAYYDRLIVVPVEDRHTIDLASIVRLRAFNPTCELYAWRSNNVLKARYREDKKDKVETGDEPGAVISVETEMNIDPVLTRKNGPFVGYSRILLRNYAKYNRNGQLYYNDMRILKLT